MHLVRHISYAAIGGIFFHLKQYPVALNFFEKALSIREGTLGDLHMDTALLFNNIGCCYDSESLLSCCLGCIRCCCKAVVYYHHCFLVITSPPPRPPLHTNALRDGLLQCSTA